MPTTKKSNKPSPAVKNRSAAIRQSHVAQAAVPDERDVAAGIEPPKRVDLDIRRAPEAGQAIALRDRATALVVTDRTSHEAALEFVRGAKQLQRAITEHWQRITRGIDDLKRNMLNFKAQDLAPVEQAIRDVERKALDYQNAENDRVRRENEERRLELERQAKADRQRELDAAEDKALELEQQSEGLSARELWFVNQVFENFEGLDLSNPKPGDLKAMMGYAKQAGYKDVDTQVARLLRSQKILDAIDAKRQAKAIREQAAAKREQPIDIVDAAPIEAKVAQGRGLPTTRTYYSCEVVDANKLREAFLNGEVPALALIPDETYLNAQARAAKSAELFERAYPGCRLVKRQGLAG